MAKGDNLGEFEMLVLTAIMVLDRSAYGMTVHSKVEELSEGLRVVSLGAIYTTLERLEAKGYVKSWFSEPTAERGGRAKKCFEVTGSGQTALNSSVRVARNAINGLEEIGGLV